MGFNWFKKGKKEEVNDAVERVETATEEKTEKPGGLVGSLRKGLTKTREILTTDIDELFTGGRKLDDELLEELEELLITADIGVRTTAELIEKLSARASGISDANLLKEALKEEIRGLFPDRVSKKAESAVKPHVAMIVGVNGVGKTTTIGKLAAMYESEGKKTLIAASDTFRAAASEQLSIWAERAGAELVKHKDNADPAAVAFDAIEAASARGKDIVIVDTAGRLHTKKNLMEELKKINRTISGKMPGAPHETILVLDATTGQNAISQAEMFNEALGVTGIALTKLDGTARGGIVIGICATLDIPLKYIGVGEKIEDLQIFNADKFVDALL